MFLFEDLPCFAIECILSKMTFVSKMNVISASTCNVKLNLKLKSLSRIRRPRYCPLCMLHIGTDWDAESCKLNLEDFHNQILYHRSGDPNWTWTKYEGIHKIKRLFKELKVCIGYYRHEKKWIRDLLLNLQQTKVESKLLFRHICNIYAVDKPDVLQFDSEKALHEHILSAHSDVIAGKDLNFYDLMFEQNPTLYLPSTHNPEDRKKIRDLIQLNIISCYLVFIDKIEFSLGFRIDSECQQAYYNSQILLLHEIACITIQNLKFYDVHNSDNLAQIYVRKLLKLHEILVSIFECLTR